MQPVIAKARRREKNVPSENDDAGVNDAKR